MGQLAPTTTVSPHRLGANRNAPFRILAATSVALRLMGGSLALSSLLAAGSIAVPAINRGSIMPLGSTVDDVPLRSVEEPVSIFVASFARSFRIVL